MGNLRRSPQRLAEFADFILSREGFLIRSGSARGINDIISNAYVSRPSLRGCDCIRSAILTHDEDAVGGSGAQGRINPAGSGRL
jgi:hypothetical protein